LWLQLHEKVPLQKAVVIPSLLFGSTRSVEGEIGYYLDVFLSRDMLSAKVV